MGRVVVIGGGPGGSTAATMLARQGHAVVLLERERFPRDHIGESLLPASLPVLEALGVRDDLERAGFLKKWGATMVWGTGRRPWSWYFRETSERYPHAYQVWRPQFDQILLDNTRGHGVDVREGHRVVHVGLDAGGPAGPARVRYEDDTGAAGTIEADFVVDASGQAAVLGRALGLRRWDPFFRNMAVYAYFSRARRLPGPDATNILVEAYPNGWCWTIPLHTGLASVGAVVDRDTARAGLQGDRLAPFLLEQIAMTDATARLLAGAEMAKGPASLRDWSYRSERLVGERFVLVGDAACFVDPLFSSGVHLALSAGVLAAAYVTSALKDAALAAAAAPVYQDLYYTQYQRFHEMARLFYSSNRNVESYFWEARRILGRGDAGYSPRQDFIRAVAGQPPQGYERAVLAQGELPDAFVRAVEGAEHELSRRRAALDVPDGELEAAVPRLAPDVVVSERPVLGEGEFVWGHALVSERRPEGAPLGAPVAALLRAVDGGRTVAALVETVTSGYPAPARHSLGRSLVAAVRILATEGAISDLRRPDGTDLVGAERS